MLFKELVKLLKAACYPNGGAGKNFPQWDPAWPKQYPLYSIAKRHAAGFGGFDLESCRIKGKLPSVAALVEKAIAKRIAICDRLRAAIAGITDDSEKVVKLLSTSIEIDNSSLEAIIKDESALKQFVIEAAVEGGIRGKRHLCEVLYPVIAISTSNPGKIVGMFYEGMTNDELRELIISPTCRSSAIAEANDVLNEYTRSRLIGGDEVCR
jgi:hypothetical protein